MIDWRTLAVSTERAADSSFEGSPSKSSPRVFMALDRPDGTETPCVFSARTRKTYDVAEVNSEICRVFNQMGLV